MQTAVFFDFAGVLDVKDSHTINHRELHWRSVAQVDVDKARMLLKFILETDAEFGCISTLEKYDAGIFVALIRALKQRGTPEDQELVNEFGRSKRRLKELYVDMDKGKNGAIEDFASRNPDTKIVVFEDEEFIDEKFGLVRVSGYNRLQESDIEKAREILSA